MKKPFIVFGAILIIGALAALMYERSVQEKRSALTPGGEPASLSQHAPFDLSFCADTLATDSGTLCAVQPSATDEHIVDVSPPTGQKGDAAIGYGYHVVAIPDDLSHSKGVWIHFTGTSGRPYDQRRDAYESSVWLEELMEEGYVVIQLAYDNRFSVNGDLCGRRSDGYNRDNCAGEVREIGLTGNGTSPYRSTDQYNTIDNRLKMLLAYLDRQHVVLPGNLSADSIDWSTLRVSGHSQGANQAYYIAKKRPVAFACLLAGGYDSADSVNPGPLNIADWFTTGTSATPVSRIGAFLTTADDSYNAFYQGLTQAVKLPKDQIVVADKEKYYAAYGAELNGHGAAVKDPSLKELRAKACFRS